MVRSDLAGSGVMFTLDTESGFDRVVLITAIYGLGENIVQGVVNPDEYVVFKPTLRGDLPAPRVEGDRAWSTTRAAGRATRNVPVPEALRRAVRALAATRSLELARYGRRDRGALQRRAPASAAPMDIEWAKDGRTSELFIVQARPETAHSQRDAAKLVEPTA